MKKILILVAAIILLSICKSPAPSGGGGGGTSGTQSVTVTYTNFGYHAAGAGDASANGNYFVLSTNTLGNNPVVVLTNIVTHTSIDQLNGYYELNDIESGIGAYDNGTSPTPLNPLTSSFAWEAANGAAPAPTITLTQQVVTISFPTPTAGLFTNKSVVWLDGNGNDQQAVAFGQGGIFQYPFGTIDGVLQSHATVGKVLYIQPGFYTFLLQDTFSNVTTVATGSTFLFGQPCCTMLSVLSGNVDFEGGTYLSFDSGEIKWIFVGLTNLVVNNCNIQNAGSLTLIAAAMGAQADNYTNLSNVLLNNTFFDLSQANALGFSGVPGTTNLLVTITGCHFTHTLQIAAGDSAPGTNSSYSTIFLQNCTALIANNTFEWGTNVLVGQTNSSHIVIGTNAYVYLGDNTFNQNSTRGLVTQIISYYTNSATTIPVQYITTSPGTNTLTVSATGVTNNTPYDYLLSITAGSAMALKDATGTQFQTPVLGGTYPLRLGWQFTGTLVTATATQLK